MSDLRLPCASQVCLNKLVARSLCFCRGLAESRSSGSGSEVALCVHPDGPCQQVERAWKSAGLGFKAHPHMLRSPIRDKTHGHCRPTWGTKFSTRCATPIGRFMDFLALRRPGLQECARGASGKPYANGSRPRPELQTLYVVPVVSPKADLNVVPVWQSPVWGRASRGYI